MCHITTPHIWQSILLSLKMLTTSVLLPKKAILSINMLFGHNSFEENIALFEKLGVYDRNSFDNLVNLSIHHHKPTSKLQAFIQLADWWASGIDRTNSEYQEEDKVKRGNLNLKEEPLISIFGNLSVNNTENKASKTAFSLRKLSLNRIFPTAEKYQTGVSQTEYAVLWHEFNSEFKTLPTDSLGVFNTSLHYLLKSIVGVFLRQRLTLLIIAYLTI
jgi:hypothetical protein